MSSEAVKKFFEAVKSDPATAERLRALEGDPDAFTRRAVELGGQRGFAFEPSDVRKLLEELTPKANAELSEEELSAVAGGVCATSYQPTRGCRTVWCAASAR